MAKAPIPGRTGLRSDSQAAVVRYLGVTPDPPQVASPPSRIGVRLQMPVREAADGILYPYIRGVPSAAMRSLPAYLGTLSPQHRLDVGERPVGGEGSTEARWTFWVGEQIA